MKWRGRAAGLIAAVGGGIVWGLAFGRDPFLGWGWVGLVPLVWLMDHPRGGRWGWLHGIVSWLVATPWIVDTLVSFGELPRALSWLLLVLLAGYLGAYHGLFVVLGRRLLAAPVAIALLGLGGLWAVGEWLRSVILGGFPWNLAGTAWVEVPGALPLAAWIGATGISVVVVVAHASLGWGLRRRRWDVPLATLCLVFTLLPLAGRFSRPEMDRAAGRKVRVLQPNLGILSGEDPEAIADAYRRVLDSADEACTEAGGALLVWPESAAWPYAWDTTPRLRRDVGRLADRGCPVVLNTPSWTEAGEVRNAALLVAGGSREPAAYFKRHLVPFGETVPLGDVLPFVDTLARHAGRFVPGDQAALLAWRDERIGMSICYEITYPAAVAEQVRAGASLLATITNDAWYGDSSAPYQHFRAARFRAAESRRPLVRAALTGISAIVDARGAVVSQLGVGEEGVLGARLHGSRAVGPYSRAPWVVPVIGLLLWVVSWTVAHRSRDPDQER